MNTIVKTFQHFYYKRFQHSQESFGSRLKNIQDTILQGTRTKTVHTLATLITKLLKYSQRSYYLLTKNPQLFLMRKFARFESVRNLYSSRYLNNCSKIYKENDISSGIPLSLFKDLNIDEAVSSIKTNSYYAGINLPQNIIQEILEYANSSTLYGNRDPKLNFYYSDKEKIEAKLNQQLILGSYYNAKNCSAIRMLESDPGLLAISAKFLGATPRHIATELWWSFPVASTWQEQLQVAQVFHYDMDDYLFLKFFFYLTEVDLASGPHVCIRGSHKNKKWSHQILGMRCASKDDQEIADYYGIQNLVTITGPAGLGFVEDAYCFHKGVPPTDKARLMLQIEFAINDYGNLRNF